MGPGQGAIHGLQHRAEALILGEGLKHTSSVPQNTIWNVQESKPDSVNVIASL